MVTQSRRNKIELRRRGGEAHAGEVAVALELAQPEGRRAGGIRGLQVVPAYANPIIEPLQCEVQVVVGLQLDHGQPSVAVDREQIERAAVRRGEGRDLREDVRGIKVCLDRRDLAAQHALQPALGLHAV